jgi:hypothetical protein
MATYQHHFVLITRNIPYVYLDVNYELYGVNSNVNQYSRTHCKRTSHICFDFVTLFKRYKMLSIDYSKFSCSNY